MRQIFQVMLAMKRQNKWKGTSLTQPENSLRKNTGPFFYVEHTKTGKNVSNNHKNTKWSWSIQNGHKNTKCHKLYQHLPLQVHPIVSQIGIFSLKKYHLATLFQSATSAGELNK
jgi:hypothetical protein